MSATLEAEGKQEFAFQAEIKRLLDLLAHSLYQSKEIAIRELISNASDALDKMRHVALMDESRRDAGELAITLEPNKEAGTLVIADDGIGMSRDELVHNLGTIAHSGSLEYLGKLSGDAKKDLSLIGQFGVGFYSAFMLADRVEVRTRSYLAEPDEKGWRWESDGTGRFTVEAADAGIERGTRIILHLKPELRDEFTNDYSIKAILKRYSGFIPHPIRIGAERVNDIRPIWVEPKSQVTDEQYNGFFQHLTHKSNEKPLWRLHFAADSPIQFHAILFCPSTNPELMGFGRLEHGLNLCAKRVLVQNDCRELLPEYLRFVVGLVDSQDLPLNISRETLQDNRVLHKIRATLVKKTLDRIHQLAEEDAENFRTFYQQFGAIVKEGINEDRDPENRKRIAKLLRYPSSLSDDPEAMVGFDAYIARMPAEQKRIYYLGGPDLASIRKSPNLEIFRQRGVEVLFLRDPIDEFVLSTLQEYEGKPLTSIDSAELDLPPAKAEIEAEKKAEPPVAGSERVLSLFRKALGDHVKEVRESTRLTDSPCCLVSTDEGMSAQMQKIMRLANKDFPIAKRIFEINPRSPLIRRLAGLTANPEHDGFVQQCGAQLYANALMLEGLFPEPQDMVGRIQTFMETAADKLSPIII